MTRDHLRFALEEIERLDRRWVPNPATGAEVLETKTQDISGHAVTVYLVRGQFGAIAAEALDGGCLDKMTTATQDAVELARFR